jgi:hypothetical protein
MLLYSMLHLTGVRAVNPAYERLGELSVTLDDMKRFRRPRPLENPARLKARSSTSTESALTQRNEPA